MAPTPHQAKAAKAQLIAGGKQPKARIQRYLKTTESKLVEGAKTALLLKGIRCSDAMSTVLKDMRSVQSPHAKLLTKSNMIVPFDDAGQQSLEFLTTKNDASLFAMASHNKKRPNNLVIGRTFDRRILDMVEIGILQYRSLTDFGGLPKKRVGSKPMMQFVGDIWSSDVNLKRMQNLLIDFYRGDPVENIDLEWTRPCDGVYCCRNELGWPRHVVSPHSSKDILHETQERSQWWKGTSSISYA